MSENTQGLASRKTSLVEIIKCVRKDLLMFILAAVLVAAAGAIIGMLTNKTSSSAQLVLSPMPLAGKSKVKTVEGKTSEDELEAMLATPLDVKSTSLLCMSDEVLQKTFDAISQSGMLSKPIVDLIRLKKALKFSVAVEKETPYDITYTPLIILTADARSPADAKLIVNTWASVVLEAAKRFQDAVQGPVAKALVERKAELHDELTQAELDSEKFWTENSTLYLEARLQEISRQINEFKRQRHEAEAEVVFDKSTAEVLDSEKADVPETVVLNWKPSAALASILGAKVGIAAPKEAASGQSDEAPFTVEVLNQAHWDIVGKLATAKANAAAKEKKIQEFDRLVDSLEKDRLKAQADLAKATTGRVRVGRELLRLEEEFRDIALKQTFAHVASSLNHPVLQVISEGAEWPVPRFQRAVQFGIVSGILGFIAAACISVLWRIFVKPAFEG